MFNDDRTEGAILSTSNAYKIKSPGKQVRNLNQQKW